MAKEWRPISRMSIRPLDGQWNHDLWFKEDHFANNVRFGLSLVTREPHIPSFYFNLSLVFTQYPMPNYMRVPSTSFSSPSYSSSLASSMADIMMMLEEIFAQPILKEYVLPSPSSNEIPLSAYFPYDLVTQTGFLLPKLLIDWSFFLDDYVDGSSDEEEDPSSGCEQH